MDGFFSADDICRLFHISRKTLRRWQKLGEFPRRKRFARNTRGRVGFGRGPTISCGVCGKTLHPVDIVER